jgi:hypothetical protein
MVVLFTTKESSSSVGATNYQGIEDGIVRGVTRISIPWWCKRKNRSMNRVSRQKVFKRKFQILSHQ